MKRETFGKSKTMWMFGAAMLFAALSITAQGQEFGKTSSRLLAGKQPAAQPASSSASSATPAPPSLGDILQLLQEQGQQLQALRDALKEQQDRTAKLEEKLNATSTAAVTAEPIFPDIAATPPTASSDALQDDLAQRVSKVENDLATSQKNMEERLGNLGPFTFSGDLRLRLEPTLGGPADKSLDQTRGRFRFRFNADTQLIDDFTGGFTLSSGDLNNPTSTNETFSQFFTRKPIAIDRAVLTYAPHFFKPLVISGGKFYPSWFSTEMVWDKDLNPEGATETLSFDLPTPALKHVRLVAFQAPFAQFKRVGTNKSTVSSVLYGGQIQATWQLAKRLTFDTFATYYDYVNADTIASAIVAPSANFSSTDSSSPLGGLLPLNSNNDLNSIATVTTSGAITKAQFASKFGILDSIARLNIETPSERWPISLLGDYAQNTEACANLSNIPAAAIFNRPCNSKARSGYWLEARVGRTDRKGDWQFWYARFVIQQEAVIGAFNYSEILPPNNTTQHKFEVDYQVYRAVGLSFTALLGRPLVTASTPLQPFYERMQFDVNYKF